MGGRCEDCKFWKKPEIWWSKRNYCDRVDRYNSETIFEIHVKVSDDTGLSTKLETGPDFGCVLFEQKGKKK